MGKITQPDGYWETKGQTRMKHNILRSYLRTRFAQVEDCDLIYIDGFAGRGMYEDGSEGSPVIAIKAILDNRPHFKRVRFYCTEIDGDNYRALCASMQEYKELEDETLTIQLMNGDFAQTARQLYIPLADDNPDSLVIAFVDPFGLKAMDYDILGYLASKPNVELIINFMAGAVVRVGNSNPQHVDGIFGCGEWRKVDLMDTAALLKIYLRRLKEAGARYIWHFGLSFPDRLQMQYYIIHTTHDLYAHWTMKDVMFEYSPNYEYYVVDISSSVRKVSPPSAQVIAYHIRMLGTYDLDEILRKFADDYTQEPKYCRRQIEEALKLLQEGGDR